MFSEGNKHLNSPSLSESQSNLETAQHSGLLGTSASQSLWCFWACYPKHSWHSALQDLQSQDLLHSQQKLWGWSSAGVGVSGAGSSAGSHSKLQFVRQEARHGKAEGWETDAQKHRACAGVSCCCGCTCQASHRGYWAINLCQKAELPSHSQQIDSPRAPFPCWARASPQALHKELFILLCSSRIVSFWASVHSSL